MSRNDRECRGNCKFGINSRVIVGRNRLHCSREEYSHDLDTVGIHPVVPIRMMKMRNGSKQTV